MLSKSFLLGAAYSNLTHYNALICNYAVLEHKLKNSRDHLSLKTNEVDRPHHLNPSLTK